VVQLVVLVRILCEGLGAKQCCFAPLGGVAEDGISMAVLVKVAILWFNGKKEENLDPQVMGLQVR
jgi:hypothetical protein